MTDNPGKSAGAGPFVLGICGAPGSGKSAFARALGEFGGAVIDADALAHDALEDAEVKKAIRENWGSEAFGSDGRVNRSALGKLVFDNEEERRKLERIVHPRVRAKMMKQMAKARKEGVAMIALDVPLLLEAGLDSWCDGVAYVDATRDSRLKRLAGRHGWDAEQAQKRESAQMPVEEKRKKANYIINNNGSQDELRRQAGELYSRLTGKRPDAEKQT